MCRIACFPPNFKRKEAIKILKDFARLNTDGTGFVYVENNKFEGNKWPKPLSYILRKKLPFLDHMPHNGWTLVHLRAASHGQNIIENTHPFIVGNWAITHNGIWREHNIVKLALKKFIRFEGETDSEVAAHLFNLAGPKRFTEEVDLSGVFVALNKNGSLWVSKTSGQLSMFELEDGKVLIASELPRWYHETLESLCGWYRFNKSGRYDKHKESRNWEQSRNWEPYHFQIPQVYRETSCIINKGFYDINKKYSD